MLPPRRPKYIMSRHLIVFLLFACTSIAAFCQQRHFTITDGLPNNQVRQIVELPNGQILVANEGAFSLYDGHRFQPLPCIPDSVHHLPSFGCHDYMWYDKSIVLLKDFYSLYIFDTSRMQFRYDYQHFIHGNEINEFLHSNVSSKERKCVDRQGGTWEVTETDGIFYHSPYPPKVKIIEETGVTTGDHIRHMMTTDDENILMANAGGIFLFNTTENTFTRTLIQGNIHCTNINRGDDSSLWISTEQGLFCYAGDKLQQFNHTNTKGFLHDHMRFACPIDKRRILVCNLLHSLGYFDPATMHFELLNDQLPELDNYRTMIDACPVGNGKKMLVATQNGLFILNTTNNSIEHPDYLVGMSCYSNKFNCLTVDSQKRIWVGSQNGLFVLVPQLSPTGNNQSYMLRYISATDGLSNICIKSIAEDAEGNVFVGTAYGLNKITIGADSMHITSYNTSDNIPESEICERDMCMMPSGNLYFSTEDHLLLFDTHVNPEQVRPLPVNLVGFLVNGLQWRATGTGSVDPALVQGDLSLRPHLRPHQNDICFRFSTLNYAYASHTHFRYRLKGFHEAWIEQKDGTDICEVRFHSLPPGSYTFIIQATTDNNSWGPATSLSLTIHPQWWQSWWAISLYIIILIGVLSKAMFVYMKHREQLLEAENEAKINKLFEIQNEAKHQFALAANVSTANLSEEAGKSLLERINKAIADNMDNVDYTVDQLASDVGMSRASLYKKTQHILGITPNDYLHNVRLKHATKLLEQGMPVNQVSLMVGFLTPRYFSQCFKKTFGISPSEYRQKE